MDNKKKITIAVVAVVAIIAIAIIVFLLTKNTNTVYTISFNTDGGNQVVSQQVEEGAKVTKPVDPSKEGYEFLGWYLNGKYFNFETEIEGNLTLDAKWKEIVVEEDKNDDKVDEDKEDKVTKYTVTFNSDGGSTVAKQTVEEGKKATEPKAPTKKGYTFKGWYLGSTKYNFSNKVTKNITLTAKWEKVEEKPVEPEVTKYTVTFDANGGTAVAKQTIEEGKTVTEPKVPERSKYTFKGWYLNGEKFDFSTPIKSNITLKAEWEKILDNYTVTFNSDGGSVVKTATVKENDTVNKPSNPTRKWDIFKGWYLDGKAFDFNTKITKDITLTAKWDKVDYDDSEKVTGSYINQVRIYVLKNNVKVAGTVDIKYSNGKIVTVNVPATGYIEVADAYTQILNVKVK